MCIDGEIWERSQTAKNLYASQPPFEKGETERLPLAKGAARSTGGSVSGSATILDGLL